MITNGSLITATDLTALTAQPLIDLKARAVKGLIAIPLTFTFAPLGTEASGSPEYMRRVTFVSPFDAMVETIAATAYAVAALSVQTVTLEGTSALGMAPTTLTWTAGAVVGAAGSGAPRILYRGGRGRADGTYLDVNPLVRTLMQGATYTLSVTSTSSLATNAAAKMTVSILTRSVLGRGL